MTPVNESNWWQISKASRGARASEALQHIGTTHSDLMHVEDAALRPRQITTGNLAVRIESIATNSVQATITHTRSTIKRGKTATTRRSRQDVIGFKIPN